MIEKTKKGYRLKKSVGNSKIGKAETVDTTGLEPHNEENEPKGKDGKDREAEKERMARGNSKEAANGKEPTLTQAEAEKQKAFRDFLKTHGYIKIGDVYAKKNDVAVLAANIEQGGSSLLIGETGTGKTSLVAALAEMNKKPLVRVSVNGTTGVEEIIGKYLAKDGSTVWQDGLLIQAMRQGHWIIFDEINSALPEILFSLHQLLDHDRRVTMTEKDGEVVVPHSEFRFFANMNPSDEYAGTKDLNKALLSRFDAVLDITVVPAILEAVAVSEKGDVPLDEAGELVALAGQLREMKRKEQLFYFCSTRDLIQAARLLAAGIGKRYAVDAAIAHKMNKEDRLEAEPLLGGYATKRPRQMPTLDEVFNLQKEIERLKARTMSIMN